MFQGPAQHLGQFLALPGLQQPQVVGDNLPRHAAFAVPAFDLEQQALPQVACAHPRRIQRVNHDAGPAATSAGVCPPTAAISSGRIDQIAVFVQIADKGFGRVANLL